MWLGAGDLASSSRRKGGDVEMGVKSSDRRF
jgi:hypothetical protein